MKNHEDYMRLIQQTATELSNKEKFKALRYNIIESLIIEGWDLLDGQLHQEEQERIEELPFREGLIEKLKGRQIFVTAGWLEKNDPDMLDVIENTDYWQSKYGHDRQAIQLAIYFESDDIGYKVCSVESSESITDISDYLWRESYEVWLTEDLALYYNGYRNKDPLSKELT